MLDKIKQLENLLTKLGPKDKTFAINLIDYYEKNGKLSPKQAPWIDTLITRATEEKKEVAKVTVGDFSGVVALFQKAKQHLKYPKIVLSVAVDGGLDSGISKYKVILSLAGAASKNPGSINVAGEGTYPDKKWYGRVSPSGEWTPSVMSSVMKEALTSILVDLSKDPAGVAKHYGKLSGNCCFCNSALTDKHSTAAGFGPVCAKHWGLENEWKTAVFNGEIPTAPEVTPTNLDLAKSIVEDAYKLQTEFFKKEVATALKVPEYMLFGKSPLETAYGVLATKSQEEKIAEAKELVSDFNKYYPGFGEGKTAAAQKKMLKLSDLDPNAKIKFLPPNTGLDDSLPYSQWAQKSPKEILSDINYAIKMSDPDTMLISPQYADFAAAEQKVLGLLGGKYLSLDENVGQLIKDLSEKMKQKEKKLVEAVITKEEKPKTPQLYDIWVKKDE